MKLVLFGATGMVGSRIATEASARGHQVLAVSRSGQSPLPGVTATAADATDPDQVAEVARGADAVASACVPPRDGSDPRGPFLALNEALVAGVRAVGVGRLMVVGGAGGLEVAPARRSATSQASPRPTSRRPTPTAPSSPTTAPSTTAPTGRTSPPPPRSPRAPAPAASASTGTS